jgi:hypothetical protein
MKPDLLPIPPANMDRRRRNSKPARTPPGPRILCGWRHDAPLPGAICAKRPAASEHGERQGGNSKVKRGRPPGRECRAAGAVAPSLPGARCARTSHLCPKRPAASDHADRRGRSLQVKRGRPPGPRMLRGWRCCGRLTAGLEGGAFHRLLELAA